MNPSSSMNRSIRHLALGLIAGYIALFVTLNYWQVGRSAELNAQPDNTRQILREFNRPRGPIITADGVVVARSFLSGSSSVTYQRNYPTGDLFAHITGYHTFGLGSTQIERTHSQFLVGTTAEQQLSAIPGLIAGRPDNSGTVQLTLRHDLQRLARDLLGDQEGSIVVIDPRTGAVLAMWSTPSFDPNQVADPDYDAAFQVMVGLQNDPRDPLLANAYQQRYMPGSTFKIVTTGIALREGVITTDSRWEPESEYLPPQATRPVSNYRGSTCGGDLTEVFARSCNTPFARIAIDLGPERFAEGAALWGIGEPLPIDLPRPAASTIGPTEDLDQNLPLLAMRGFGQNEDQIVPLHMAMIAGAVANRGQMMAPYVVEAEIDQQGRVLRRAQPRVWKTPLGERNAQIMTDLMVQVSTVGTARCCIALENGVSVASKTGTAQLNEPGEPERSHAWITAFAPADNPQFVVAVMLKGTSAEISAGTGGQLAGPLAKRMLDAALSTVAPQ
jgi:peptidoglycan glycosyltransferase